MAKTKTSFFVIATIWIVGLLYACSNKEGTIHPFSPRNTQREGFVYVNNNRFMLDGNEWFPLMLNYKAFPDNSLGTVRIVSLDDYKTTSIAEDFALISSLGFNSIRLCLNSATTYDTAEIYGAIGRIIDTAAMNNLRVMFLVDPPFDSAHIAYTQGLLRHFADNPAIWAYDFFNEPLYFDKVENRDKIEAYNIVCSWREMMCQNAPNQLFTIGFSEPIEVFEWDPTILPVDFVEIHTYHPLRVASEMYWYSNVVTDRPWMVGETSLPADNDSVSYREQQQFMLQVFAMARSMGAAGFGWWGFVDCPTMLVNFEGQYTGLLSPARELKLAAYEVKRLMDIPVEENLSAMPPNYYNMLGYNNIFLKGRVVDEKTGKPVSNALIRGWNVDWSIGMNTYSDGDGNFTLYSNDFCVHFEVSAPGMHTKKFDDHTLSYTFADSVPNHKWQYESFPNKSLEYQSIDYHPFLEGDSLVLIFNPRFFNQSKAQGNIGTIKLKCIKISDK